MKVSKFTEAQIAFVLKQAEDGTPVAEVCQKQDPGSDDVAPNFYPALSSPWRLV